MKQLCYANPKTKWQLANAIEELSRLLKYNPWEFYAMMTVCYQHFTKDELKVMYENLQTEYEESSSRRFVSL